MNNLKTQELRFIQGLETLGFANDDCLHLTNQLSSNSDIQIRFHLEKARKFGAKAVYLRKQLNGSYKPQVYLYDYTNQGFNTDIEKELTNIQKKIWSSGEAPLACVFFKTEIKIIDCTKHYNSDNYTPEFLVEHLEIAGKVHKIYNEQFAIKLKSGVFWDELENKDKFKFSNSAYDKLIDWIKKVNEVLIKENSAIDKLIINKIIIQSILIKYLEEKRDHEEKNLFGEKYFHQFDNAIKFTEVLRNGKFVALLEKLHTDFNGNLFNWNDIEKAIINKCSFQKLADALDGISEPDGQKRFENMKLYEFNFVPVELISRLYEEFLAGHEKEGDKKKNKQDDGIFYTPAHLARLLVDESMPLNKGEEVDLKTFKILDPACGSGIFLVIAFKRLVQWWRLKNGFDAPRTVSVLKELQKCVFGIDKEEQATQLAAFSMCLALCDELSPMQILDNLRFEDLTQTNILNTDFFINELKLDDKQNISEIKKQKSNYQKLDTIKFDLVIGNPPFNRGALKAYSQTWEYEGVKVKIPQGQIALKFLSESLPFLKDNGLMCLIIKSSGLLYNSTSEAYKKLLFSELNIIQLFDFTALARNGALWDNGARVGSAAIFLRKAKPDYTKNILHLTFRRTKATKERIAFEIDDYDLHFVNRKTAIDNNAIWKCNLLGGGRIKTVLEKSKHLHFGDYLKETNCIVGEGFIVGSKGNLNPDFIYKIQTLPTDAIGENEIDYQRLESINSNIKFEKIPPQTIFETPNILIRENVGNKRIPIHINNRQPFSFKHQIIGISNNANPLILDDILKSFEKYNDFYRFYIISTSGYTLINRNTATLKLDFINIPFVSPEMDFQISNFDNSIIKDVNGIMRDFIIKGENSQAVQPISNRDIETIIKSYGNEFASVLNLMYEEENKKFRLSKVVSLGNSFIATVFKYDELSNETTFHLNQTTLDIIGLSDNQVSKHLNINRIIKLYPQKDTIVFVKPNQQRYWISLIAYRDADKCFADLSKAGY